MPETCILYVSKSYLQDYKDVLGSKYPYIYASKDGGEDSPSEQCATPTITYAAANSLVIAKIGGQSIKIAVK